MQKDFDKWNNLKKIIHNNEKNIFFHEREIWVCSIGLNVGYEQDGKNDEFIRPVIILSKFNNDIFCGVPLTSKEKNFPFYFSFKFKDGISTAIVSQLKTFDKRRLVRKLGMIAEPDFIKLKNRIKEIVNL